MAKSKTKAAARRKARAAQKPKVNKAKLRKDLSARKGKAEQRAATKTKAETDKVVVSEAEQRRKDSDKEVAKHKAALPKGASVPLGLGGFRRDIHDNKNEMLALNSRADANSGPGPSGPADSAPPSGYPVLPPEVRAAAPVRPVRYFVVHKPSGTVTELPRDVAETLARDPTFYKDLWAPATHGMHPIGEFVWKDTTPEEVVGSDAPQEAPRTPA